MKASTTALLLAVALSASCAPATSVSDAPEWLTALIQQLETQPVANPPAFIARYEYQGRPSITFRRAAVISQAMCTAPQVLSSAMRMAD